MYPTCSVVIATHGRSTQLRRSLELLALQTVHPDQTIVVDSSPDSLTRELVAGFPGVKYLRNDAGYGFTSQSRNIGTVGSSGTIVVYLDDDAYAEPDWLRELLATYEEGVGAVGGRALNGMPGEETRGADDIGRLHDNGEISGNFAADPGATIDVDHVIGCNMSVSRAAFDRVGGFREDFPRHREETDFCLRLRRVGLRIRFNPRAVVFHEGAPYPEGRRFGPGYSYLLHRNHVVMLARNYGYRDPRFRRYLVGSSAAAVVETARRCGAAVGRLGLQMAGSVSGAVAGVRYVRRHGLDPAVGSVIPPRIPDEAGAQAEESHG